VLLRSLLLKRFILVHQLLSPLQKAVHGARFSRVVPGQAQADGQGVGAAILFVLRPDVLLEPGDDHIGIGLIAGHGDNNKFVAADAGNDVRFAKRGLQNMRRIDYRIIAFMMAELIIDLLEVVQVGIEQEDVVLIAAGQFQQRLRHRKESPTIVETGKFVGKGKTTKLILHLFEIGDIF